MTTPPGDHVGELMRRGDQYAWSLAALALVLRQDGPDNVRAAAAGALVAAGIDPAEDFADLDPELAAGQAAAPLLQTAKVASGAAPGWQDQTDEALLAQGRASGQLAAMFERFMLPQLDGLARALQTPGARMLDVGTGTAALAVSYAERFETLTVVGLDVWPRVLALAERTVSMSSAAARVVLRHQDVATLDETDVYDVAWIPAPFCPEPALTAGIPRMARALKPGGWLVLGHARFAGDALDDALTRFKTLVFGGTALNDDEAGRLLTACGLVDVRTLPSLPPGAPGITVGRRAAG